MGACFFISKIKRALRLGFVEFLIFSVFCVPSVWAQDMDISAKSAILMCADSCSVLWSKNETEPLPMASTTKIMTALLALEAMRATKNKEVEISEEMVKVEGTSMGLRAGDIVDLTSLAQGMLLCSGNDAANAAAIAVSGNTENFIFLMNEKAKLIGMKDTKFVTPSGLDKDDHHSTAKDMAVLGAYAMENEDFAKIVSQKSMRVKFINPSKVVSYKNHNKLLRLYSGCIGIKTGFTKSAGRCLVSCAEKNGIRLICVTLNAPNDWEDHIKLYNFGFENTESKVFDDRDLKIEIPIKNFSNEKIIASGVSSFSRTFKKGEGCSVVRSIEAPKIYEGNVQKGQTIGKVVYYLGSKVIGTNDIVSNSEFIKKAPEKKSFFGGIVRFFENLFKKQN